MMESMSMSQQSQPNEHVSPAMGEMYMLFQWIPNDEESYWFQSNQIIHRNLGLGATYEEVYLLL